MKDYLVPTVIESDGRTERAYDIYSRLLKSRIVYLGELVNEHTANLIIAQMLFLEADNAKEEIKFYINSTGGTVYDGLAIYDTMNFVKCDVRTIGVGVQASMAAFLLSSGTKGKRLILPHSTVMIHQPTSGTQGKVTDMEIDLKEGLRVKKLMSEIFAQNTGQKLAKIAQDMERDYWMTAEEAKAYGLVDEVISGPKHTAKK